MNNTILLLGGNLGDVNNTFYQARQKIALQAGPILKVSSVYQSEPWGFQAENKFLNQVLVVETSMNPEPLMELLLSIEFLLGRSRRVKSLESRPIDIDLLFYNDQVIVGPLLEVPHPRLHLRRFTLLPLVEIVPEMVHPVFGTTMLELLENCPDKLSVVKLINETGKKN